MFCEAQFKEETVSDCSIRHCAKTLITNSTQLRHCDVADILLPNTAFPRQEKQLKGKELIYFQGYYRKIFYKH